MGAGFSQPLSGVVRRVLTVWLVGIPKGVLLQAQPDQLRQLLRVERVCHWRHRHEPLRQPRHRTVTQPQTIPNPFPTHQNHSLFPNSLSACDVCTTGDTDMRLQRHEPVIQPQTIADPFLTHPNHSVFPNSLSGWNMCTTGDRCEPMRLPRHEPVIQSQTIPNPFPTLQNHSLFHG